ncbi:hypothetical protein SJAV_19710 [Sulfurisphaera javensis]|uniref:Uncharacterized protein n=1 Tax=Sulfurisphaera javensis TaxID=2049879 RepID=A0AAT9GSZ0_9CREN
MVFSLCIVYKFFIGRDWKDYKVFKWFRARMPVVIIVKNSYVFYYS